MTIGTGVVTNDFAQILSDMGRTVSWKKVTKTTDPMTGSETSTFAAASNLTVVYFKEDQRYLWDPSGLVEVADAYVLYTPGTISRYDQITVDSITYYVEEVIQRYVTTVSMVDYVRLFKVA
jgi:hypothetical protein